MVDLLRNYYNGQWQSAHSSQTFSVINPANEELLAKTPLCGEKEVDEAVQSAQGAFSAWKKIPASDRTQYLFRLKTELEDHFEDLSRTITIEHGKTLNESRGSVRRAIQMVETACSIPTLMMGENFEDIAKGIDCSTVNRPMGVFACIAPFNFPAMVPFWFWPFAVACGNTFIIKASERVPLTAIKIFELIDKVGFPPGVVNLVHGGKEAVNALCVHPLVKGVSFVGSTPVAKHVYQTACHQGKRVQALGGAKNVMVAMPDAMEKTMGQKSIATAFESITGCAGERCLAGSLVLCIGKETYESFKNGCVTLAKNLVVGSGLDPKTSMGPLISMEAKERVSGLIDRAIKQGAKALYDGREGLEKLKGYFLKPTILSNIKADMEIAQEEIFGPVVLLAEVESLQNAIDWINALPLANTTTIFTNNGAHARKFASEVDPSMIGVNIGVPAPMSFFSFGGSKESFFGDIKAHGKASVRFYTDTYTTIYRWHHEGSIW